MKSMIAQILVGLVLGTISLSWAGFARERKAKALFWQATLAPATEAFTSTGRHACFILETGEA